MIFLKKVDLDLKKVDLDQKNGQFIHDFLKNEDLDVRFSKKSGPRSEKYGPLPKK